MVALLAGAFAAHAQGLGPLGWVSFGNYLDLLPSRYIYVSYNGVRLGGSSTGPTPTTSNYASETANGNDWTVQLYGYAGAGDAPGTLLPATTAGGQNVTAMFATGHGMDTVPGTWYSTLIANIPGTTGGYQPATLQVDAWYNDGGAITSYAQAVAAGVPSGHSATALVYTGGMVSSGPPISPYNLPLALGNFTLSTPEPSTIALGLMGGAAILLGLRCGT